MSGDRPEERPQPIATLKENLSTNFGRVDRAFSTLSVVAMLVLPLAQAVRYGFSADTAIPVVEASLGLVVVLTIAVRNWAPDSLHEEYGFALATAAVFVVLRWLLQIDGGAAGSWLAAGQAVLVYLAALGAAHLLIHRRG